MKGLSGLGREPLQGFGQIIGRDIFGEYRLAQVAQQNKAYGAAAEFLVACRELQSSLGCDVFRQGEREFQRFERIYHLALG